MLFGFSSTFSNPSSRVLIFLFILAPATLIQSQECYFPDGSPAKNDYPCLQVSSDSNFTFCCGNYDWKCSSNKVCTNTTDPQMYARGSCTDVSWQSSGCPHFCKQIDANHGTGMSLCEPSGLWCCNEGSEPNICCRNVTNLFSLEAATATLSSSSLITAGSLGSVSSSQASSSTTSGSLSSINTPISSSTTIDSSIPASTVSGFPISIKAGIGVGAKVGIVVGVLAAVALVVLLVYLLYSNKRLRGQIQGQSAEKSNHSQQEMTNGLQQQMDLIPPEPHELWAEPRRDRARLT